MAANNLSSSPTLDAQRRGGEKPPRFFFTSMIKSAPEEVTARRMIYAFTGCSIKAPSRTCLTFPARPEGVNGFGKNSIPGSNIP